MIDERFAIFQQLLKFQGAEDVEFSEIVVHKEKNHKAFLFVSHVETYSGVKKECDLVAQNAKNS